jgi:hypothetical protein
MSASNGDSRRDPPPSPSRPPPGMLLAGRFPVNSLVEVTLFEGATFAGRVYCTDEMTGSLVLKASLVHTTLACEMRIINVASIKSSKFLVLPASAPPAMMVPSAVAAPAAAESVGSTTTTAPTAVPSNSSASSILDPALSPEFPLPKIQKKALEERERKALKLAEEKVRQINQKVRRCDQKARVLFFFVARFGCGCGGRNIRYSVYSPILPADPIRSDLILLLLPPPTTRRLLWVKPCSKSC